MKSLFSILFLLIGFLTYSQSSLDSQVMIKLNYYRDSLNVGKIQFNQTCHRTAEIQSTYLKETNEKRNEKSFIVGHSNQTSGFEKTSDRYEKSGGKKYKHLGENVAFFSFNVKITDTTDSYSKLTDQIIRAWKKSPEHNRIMISSSFNYGACSIKLQKSKYSSKKWTSYYVYATLVLVDSVD